MPARGPKKCREDAAFRNLLEQASRKMRRAWYLPHSGDERLAS